MKPTTHNEAMPEVSFGPQVYVVTISDVVYSYTVALKPDLQRQAKWDGGREILQNIFVLCQGLGLNSNFMTNPHVIRLQ